MTKEFRVCLAFAVLALVSSTSAAGASIYGISFLPEAPISGQAVVAHVSNSYGPFCTPDPGSIAKSGTTITLIIELSDACSPQDRSYRDFSLGSLEAGIYNVAFQTCTSYPAPQPRTCRTELLTELVVGRAPVVSVPSLSSWWLLALILGLVGISQRRADERA